MTKEDDVVQLRADIRAMLNDAGALLHRTRSIVTARSTVYDDVAHTVLSLEAALASLKREGWVP